MFGLEDFFMGDRKHVACEQAGMEQRNSQIIPKIVEMTDPFFLFRVKNGDFDVNNIQSRPAPPHQNLSFVGIILRNTVDSSQ